MGRDPALSTEEESALVTAGLDLANQGTPLSRKHLKKAVREIVSSSDTLLNRSKINMKTGPSSKWINRFLRRHPELHIRVTKPKDDCSVFLTRSDSDKILKVNITLKELEFSGFKSLSKTDTCVKCLIVIVKIILQNCLMKRHAETHVT